METSFTVEIGAKALRLIQAANWRVHFEHRHHGDATKFQSLEDIFNQVAEDLKIGPRYHVFPAPLDFDAFIRGVTLGTLQLPRVTIGGQSRILFGFGMRGDHCYFVTNDTPHAPSADREPKNYEYMLDALETLEPFKWPRART